MPHPSKNGSGVPPQSQHQRLEREGRQLQSGHRIPPNASSSSNPSTLTVIGSDARSSFKNSRAGSWRGWLGNAVNVHSVPELTFAAKSWWGNEFLDKNSTVRRDDSLGRHIVWLRGDVNVTEAFRLGLSEHFAQSTSSVAAALFPRHYCIPDMP